MKEIRSKVTLYREHLANGGYRDFARLDDLTCPNGCNTSVKNETLQKYGKPKEILLYGYSQECQFWQCNSCNHICYEIIGKQYIDINQNDIDIATLSDEEVVSNEFIEF